MGSARPAVVVWPKGLLYNYTKNRITSYRYGDAAITFARVLYTEWKPGWQAVVNRTLEDWEHKQASATVRDHTDVAVEQLRLMGYEVTPPS